MNLSHIKVWESGGIKWVGAQYIDMYEPETSITGFGDSVLVPSTDPRYPYRIGRYTGNKNEASESFEIAVHSMWQEGTDFTAFYHKEDIYENTEENVERLKD